MIDMVLIILEQTFLHIPLLLGAYISISCMKIPDLSLESAYVTGAIFGAYVLMFGGTMPAGMLLIGVILASLLGGALVGLVSSCIAQQGKVPHLLASIITIGLFHGFNQFIFYSYQSLNTFQNPLNYMPLLFHHPELSMLFILAIIIVLLIFFLFKTELGYSFMVYGNNCEFFQHYTISTSFVVIMGLLISNALAGFSGYLCAQSNNFVEINMGFGKVLMCITSLMLGKAVIRVNKVNSCAIPIIGVFCYFSLQQFLLKIGFNLKYFTAVQSVIILLILFILCRKNGQHKKIDHLGV